MVLGGLFWQFIDIPRSNWLAAGTAVAIGLIVFKEELRNWFPFLSSPLFRSKASSITSNQIIRRFGALPEVRVYNESSFGGVGFTNENGQVFKVRGTVSFIAGDALACRFDAQWIESRFTEMDFKPMQTGRLEIGLRYAQDKHLTICIDDRKNLNEEWSEATKPLFGGRFSLLVELSGLTATGEKFSEKHEFQYINEERMEIRPKLSNLSF